MAVQQRTFPAVRMADARIPGANDMRRSARDSDLPFVPARRCRSRYFRSRGNYRAGGRFDFQPGGYTLVRNLAAAPGRARLESRGDLLFSGGLRGFSRDGAGSRMAMG